MTEYSGVWRRSAHLTTQFFISVSVRYQSSSVVPQHPQSDPGNYPPDITPLPLSPAVIPSPANYSHKHWLMSEGYCLAPTVTPKSSSRIRFYNFPPQGHLICSIIPSRVHHFVYAINTFNQFLNDHSTSFILSSTVRSLLLTLRLFDAMRHAEFFS